MKRTTHNQEFDFINLWNTIPKYRFDVDDDKFEKFFERQNVRSIRLHYSGSNYEFNQAFINQGH